MSRLYEFAHWLVTALISFACSRMPAMNARAVAESWIGSLGSWNAFVSPSNRLKCVCIAEPGYCVNGFGMKVARTPWLSATSFTT